MLITEKEKIAEIDKVSHRIWQGIPAIERTPKGRTFISYYTGGVTEEIGNYVCLYKSDDEIEFGEPIAICYAENGRCFDANLWIDPLGRLWFSWTHVDPECRIYTAICDDPDADEIVFGEPFCLTDRAVQMLNKPTVLSTGEWLFPVYVWRRDYLRFFNHTMIFPENQDGAYVLKTSDNGKTFTLLGSAIAEDRSFDESMVLEKKDGTLAMYIRTNYGIAVCYSYDRGKTFTRPVNSGIPGPCSRFHIRRLRSGNVLMINHYNFTGRDHLHAMISEDDGKTFPYRLLLDERAEVSYPDCTENEDGSLSIVYDRERGAAQHSLEQVYAKAREIIMCHITEEDIRAGACVGKESYLKRVISRLGKHAEEEKNPFGEYYELYSNREVAEILIASQPKERIIPRMFELYYGIPCTELNGVDVAAFDSLVKRFEEAPACDAALLAEILAVLRRGKKEKDAVHPIVVAIREYVREHYADSCDSDEIAERFRISRYYMFHLFKLEMGITIGAFRKECQLTAAKKMLVDNEESVSEIAGKCGYYDANYFSRVFKKSEGVTPSEYRRLHRK